MENYIITPHAQQSPDELRSTVLGCSELDTNLMAGKAGKMFWLKKRPVQTWRRDLKGIMPGDGVFHI